MNSLAIQCPATGGEAVYRARVMLSIVNDSLEYDDVTACLQVGIYREIKKDGPSFHFELVPNPAKDVIILRFHNTNEGICKIDIMDIRGAELMSTDVNCETAEHNINIENLPNGVYLIKIYYQNIYQRTEKLIVIR